MLIEEIRFARDLLVEETEFELVVPLSKRDSGSELAMGASPLLARKPRPRQSDKVPIGMMIQIGLQFLSAVAVLDGIPEGEIELIWFGTAGGLPDNSIKSSMAARRVRARGANVPSGYRSR